MNNVFTEDVVEFLVDVLKTNEVAIKTFRTNLEDRATELEILSLAKNWKNATTGMKSNMAIATMGVYYAGWYLYLMEYLSEKMENENKNNE